ncbi:ribosomal protein S19 binding protein 1 [Sardina pilchardus]|uniref:ribosomal protein S19 binding protein 1 n=1 Tax=Sardina pilchardus TaxID=27697 RepID=UPI002E0E137D
MSASMVRRGLELLSGDIKDVHSGPKHKKRKAGASARDLISSNRQGVSKQLRRLQGQHGAAKSKTTVKDKHVKSAIDEYRKKQAKSHLSANLQYFLGSSCSTKQSATQKIVNQNSGRQSRHWPDRPVVKPKQEKSIFSEEEFQQFQKEYFGKIVEGGN